MVKLQKNGTRIAEINIGEFFDIFVGNSTGSISKVRFLSDENQNNIVDEGFTWTDPYDWNVSKDDWTGSWNATSKIKTWAFVTPGIKEVWAEITDSSGNTSRHNADIIAYPESSQRFLTPPYKDAEIKVQQGWTSSRDPDHQGIDYIKGPIDNAGTIDKPLWQTFNVVAAADGIARQGIEASGSKYVKILHPQKAPSGKNYCTYYGHLDTISDKIKPNICVPVKRGEFIGEAGATGVPYPPGDPPWIHLHFTVLADNFPNCVDPYDIYNTREHYPRGTEDTECIIHTNCGQDRLWITDPPAVFIFRLKCPTDLIVTDPDGVTISKEIGATNGMYYMEYDPNGNGEINDVVGIVDAKVGNYQIRVVPEQDAPTTATYTLEVSGEDRAVILADNVQIGNIPTEPYTVNSIEVLPITRTAVSPSIWTLYQ